MSLEEFPRAIKMCKDDVGKNGFPQRFSCALFANYAIVAGLAQVI